MAQPTNTFDSYGARGNREDLQDKIYMVSPEKTPVMSNGRRFKATNRIHEWQRDSLAAPNKDNAVIEGDDRTGTALTPTERVANTTQLFDKTIIVTDAQERHNSAGRSSEKKYQIAKGYAELKRDMEAMITSENPAVQGNSTTARKSAGLGVLLFTNTSHGSGGSTASHTSGLATTATTGGTNRAFAIVQVNTVMQSIYTNSGDMPSMVSVTPSHKVLFSAFTGIAANRLDLKTKRNQGAIIGGADVYVSDFGDLTIMPNYVQATSNPNAAYILNPDYYGVAFFSPFEDVDLAKTGHTEKTLIRAEATLVVTSQTAHGKVDDLTP